MSAPVGGTGAALGAKVLRYSWLNSVGVVLTNLLTFVSTIVLANIFMPSEFGSFGLLMFFASLLTLVFNLASKQGTLKRTFGGDDEDDDDDDDKEELDLLAESSAHSLGTGLCLTGLVSLFGIAITALFAGSIGDALLAGAEPAAVVWAAVLGGAAAIFRLASIAIWMEGRAYPYIALEAMRPLLTMFALLAFLLDGGGVDEAIAATAIGTLATSLLALLLLRRSAELSFDLGEAITIYRRGAVRIPVVLSFWAVGYLDIFLLSLYVDTAELGIYHLASRAGFLVSFLPAGYRKALRPLRRSTTFAAVEAEYGSGTLRGIQFGYFVLMLVGVLLGVTLLAQVVVRVAPPAYADAAPLIPLLSAGMVAPTIFRMLNKSAKFGGKKFWFIGSAISAGVLFVAFSLALIPLLDLRGAPVAMMLAYSIPAAVIVYKAQTGRTPTDWPLRMIVAALVPAIGAVLIYELVDPNAIWFEVGLAVVLMVGWIGSIFFTGAIPSYHRAALVEMYRGFRGRGEQSHDPDVVLAALTRNERRALRRAVARHKTPEEAVEGLIELGSTERPAAAVIGLLRRGAAAAGNDLGDPSRGDAAIGDYLFGRRNLADRSKAGRSLLESGATTATELHNFEVLVEGLAALPRQTWVNPNTRS